MASSSPRRASVTASSSAAAAARAVSGVGTPGLQFGCRPRSTYSVESGTRPDFRASSTISGPIPAQSPSVMPMRGFVVLMLLLVIVIEFAQSSTSRIKRRDGRLRLSERGRAECASERLDVSLCAQAGDPAFLNTLCFLLKQFLLDIVPRFGKRTRSAAAFIFDFDNIIIAGEIDDVADSTDRHVEGELFKLGSQS